MRQCNPSRPLGGGDVWLGILSPARHMDIRERVPCRENGKCQGPEAGTSLKKPLDVWGRKLGWRRNSLKQAPRTLTVKLPRRMNRDCKWGFRAGQCEKPGLLKTSTWKMSMFSWPLPESRVFQILKRFVLLLLTSPLCFHNCLCFSSRNLTGWAVTRFRRGRGSESILPVVTFKRFGTRDLSLSLISVTDNL